MTPRASLSVRHQFSGGLRIPSSIRKPRELGAFAALAALLATALVLRAQLVDRSLWFDELLTVLKAEEAPGTLLDGLADDVHPPLYYLMLHGWVGLVGETPSAVRALSIGWSGVTIVAAWGWAREAFPGTRVPLVAAALTAFAPFAVWYATEVRMYSQVLALSALAGWAAWRTFGRGPSPARVAALTLAVTALLWTHYLAGLFVAALGALGLAHVLLRPASRAAGVWVMAACFTAAVSLAPWVAFVLEHRSDTSPTPTLYPEPDFYSVAVTGLEMVIGFQPFDVLGVLAAGWPLLGLLALALLPRMTGVSWRAAGVMLLCGLPAALLVAASLYGPRSAFDPRFLAACAVPLWLLAARLVSGHRLVVTLAVIVATAVLGTLGAIRQNESAANPKYYDYAGAIEAVNQRAEPGDALLLLPNFAAAGHVGEPVYAYYPPEPGLLVPDTRSVGQRSGASVREGVERLWERLERLRPKRVFVIDAFAEHSRGRAAASAAHAALRWHMARSGRLPFPNATVHVYRPDWRNQ